MQRQHHVLNAGCYQIIGERLLILQVGFGAGAANLVERRLGNIEMAALDHLRHLPIEEGEEERADMCAIDVGVRHDDDLVVAQLVDIEIVAADTGAKRGDECADFIRGQHLVEARAFHVEDLATQWQHRLIGAVARLFRGAAG